MKKQLTILTFLIFLAGSKMRAQDWNMAGNALAGGEKLGGSSGNFPIDFYINNVKKMSLTTGGDIDITTSTDAYQIATFKVLWCNGIASDIFVGVGAGANNGATALRNVFVGNDAGNANTGNSDYTFVGYRAGYTANGGSTNTYIGSQAGMNDATGYENAYVGKDAGVNCNGCTDNTYIGQNAGKGPAGTTNVADYNTAVGYNSFTAVTTGSLNASLGASAGAGNTSGNNNVYVGYNTGGTNATGTNNTIIGNAANVGSDGLVNATAIGNAAVVNASNTMILGNNNVTGVGIGYSGASLTTNAKLDVLTTGASLGAGINSYAGNFRNTNTCAGSAPSSYTYLYGLYGESSGASTSAYEYNYGGTFKGLNAYRNVGVAGISTTGSSGQYSYGGYFNSTFSASATGGASYGVAAFTGSNGGLANIAIYGSGTTSSNNTLPNWGGYFVNDVYITGNGWISAAWNIVSDKKYKKNIDTISDPMSIINSLSPKSYNYDTANTDGLQFSYKKQYGFVAQDLLQVLPEVVSEVTKPAETDADGKIVHAATNHLGVNYNSFVAIMAAALKQQDKKILTLESRISQLEGSGNRTNNNGNLNSGGENNGSTTGNSAEIKNKPVDVELSDANIVVLNQNVPNPFAEQTIITFNIPKNTGFAQVLFYDANGRLIKAVDIAKKGPGSLNVFANDLSSGTYSYNLVIDGKIYDTKKMVKQ